MEPQPLHPAIVEYEEGRATKQRMAFFAMRLLMLAVLAFGIWVIVASHQQYPGRIESWVGTAFGAIFALLGLVTVFTAGEVLLRLGRLAEHERVLLLLDETGVTDTNGETVAWDDIASIEAGMAAPAARRTNRMAQLDPEHRASLGVRRSLDRTAGQSLGVRDGKRWVRVLLHDGSDRRTDLTLPVGPERFEAVATAIGEHCAHQQVPFVGPS